jgi:hypothetical protein
MHLRVPGEAALTSVRISDYLDLEPDLDPGSRAKGTPLAKRMQSKLLSLDGRLGQLPREQRFILQFHTQWLGPNDDRIL